MKHVLVIDDLRCMTGEEEMDYGLVTYARTAEAALEAVKTAYEYDEIWLDHDLGDGDVRSAVCFLEELAQTAEPPPSALPIIRIISANPVGRQYIKDALSKGYTIEGHD